MRAVALLACAGFLVAAAVLPGHGGDQAAGSPPAEARAAFTDASLPGLEFWLEPATGDDGGLVVNAVAHRTGPQEYGVRVWGCNVGSWTSGLSDAAGRELGVPMQAVLMCVGNPALVHRMGEWMNHTPSWDGRLASGEPAPAPGEYELRFTFLAYDGPVDASDLWTATPVVTLTPAVQVDAPQEARPEPWGNAVDPAGWHRMTLALPVTLDADGALHAGEPRLAEAA